MTLNCFPRVRIVHTSSKVRGQIYIPEINWCLMTVGVALVLGFTLTQPGNAPVNTAQLGSAYGELFVLAASISLHVMGAANYADPFFFESPSPQLRAFRFTGLKGASEGPTSFRNVNATDNLIDAGRM